MEELNRKIFTLALTKSDMKEIIEALHLYTNYHYEIEDSRLCRELEGILVEYFLIEKSKSK